MQNFVACPFISFLRILFARLKINGAANKSELVVQPYRVFGASPYKAEPYFSAGLQARPLNEFGGHFFCPVHTRFPGGGQVGQWLFPARDTSASGSSGYS